MQELNEAAYRHVQNQGGSINFGYKAFDVISITASRNRTTITEFDVVVRLVMGHAMESIETTVQSTELTCESLFFELQQFLR